MYHSSYNTNTYKEEKSRALQALAESFKMTSLWVNEVDTLARGGDHGGCGVYLMRWGMSLKIVLTQGR